LLIILQDKTRQDKTALLLHTVLQSKQKSAQITREIRWSCCDCTATTTKVSSRSQASVPSGGTTPWCRYIRRRAVNWSWTHQTPPSSVYLVDGLRVEKNVDGPAPDLEAGRIFQSTHWNVLVMINFIHHQMVDKKNLT